jgi:hypothetical protein
MTDDSSNMRLSQFWTPIDIYSTANDITRWIKWHLDRAATADRDLRLLDHAAYLYRDGLASALGLDEGAPMDAMGLGWVINMPDGHRPLILQKSGGLKAVSTISRFRRHVASRPISS